MTIISAVKDYLSTYTGLDANAPIWVDFIGTDPTQYVIIPLPGTKIVQRYLDGSSLREFPFVFKSTQSTSDEPERMENSGFYEAFSDWLETQTEAGVLPTLTGSPTKTAEKIEALGWGYLFEQGQSGTGLYSVQCKLTYSQVAT